MKSGVARVWITSPDGRSWTHELTSARITVGRGTPGGSPDLSLDPDPHRLVSRVHCVLEYVDGAWSVIDNASANGTVLRRSGVLTRVFGATTLRHADTVLILGDFTDTGEPRHWRLKFDDPFRTQPAPVGVTSAVAAPYLDYDWIQMKVWRVEGAERTEVDGLTPQAHKLIRHMAELSRLNSGSPVACTHTELIHMMWGPPEEWPPGRVYDESNLRNIVNAARKRIERDPADPRLLQTERNIGYRLVVRTGQAGAAERERGRAAG
ncbi:MAG: FHA domain-containing protein [Saccharothrix sp.]|nr:FHA domain-containing protein [Saccharothrix sp.]